MSDPVRVRIAPSPTGTVHLGLCRTALFNWAYARGRGGTFVLRVEDTDTERNTDESLRAILDGLRWLGVEWDEGPDVGGPYAPYLQSERAPGHLARAEALLESGHAYRDFSTPEQLDAWRAEQEARKQRVAYRGPDRDLDRAESDRRAAAGEAFALRFRIPEGETTFTDLVRGEVTFPHHEIDDWVLVRRGGGLPLYNFVVVCDDIDMRITHVLRGEEHLVNTPKQLMLYAALGETPPAFGHLPLMLGSDKKKLSKRTGDTSLGDYRANGFPRLAILNFLALQGWALDGETELFTPEQLVERFDPGQVAKAGAIFDLDKFRWMAGEYLRAETPAELLEHCAPFLTEVPGWTPDLVEQRGEWLGRVLHTVRERLTLYADAPEWVAPFLAADDAVVFDPKAEQGARKRERGPELLAAFAARLRERGGVQDPAAHLDETKAWLAEQGAKIPELFQPLRLVLSGQPGGPDLFETLELLGLESSLARIEHGLARLG